MIGNPCVVLYLCCSVGWGFLPERSSDSLNNDELTVRLAEDRQVHCVKALAWSAVGCVSPGFFRRVCSVLHEPFWFGRFIFYTEYIHPYRFQLVFCLGCFGAIMTPGPDSRCRLCQKAWMSPQRGKAAMFLVCFCRASGFCWKDAWDVRVSWRRRTEN